jgi:hypothetical protein
MNHELHHHDDDADALERFGATLRHNRPVPSAAFRGDLGRRLAGRAARRGRPARLWLTVAGSASLGSALLAVAAIGVAGSGPFAA